VASFIGFGTTWRGLDGGSSLGTNPYMEEVVDSCSLPIDCHPDFYDIDNIRIAAICSINLTGIRRNLKATILISTRGSLRKERVIRRKETRGQKGYRKL
jgi:hypothetical protein